MITKSLSNPRIEKNWTAVSEPWLIEPLTMLSLQHEDLGIRLTRLARFHLDDAAQGPPPPPALTACASVQVQVQLKHETHSEYEDPLQNLRVRYARGVSERGLGAESKEETRRYEGRVSFLSKVLLTHANVVDLIENAAKVSLTGSVWQQVLQHLGLRVSIAHAVVTDRKNSAVRVLNSLSKNRTILAHAQGISCVCTVCQVLWSWVLHLVSDRIHSACVWCAIVALPSAADFVSSHPKELRRRTGFVEEAKSFLRKVKRRKDEEFS